MSHKAAYRQKKNGEKENLKQRAYLNSVTSVIDYLARIITRFVVTPFLVHGLGSTLFGVWKVLGQLAGYANLADVRATQVLKWAVAKDRETLSGKELRKYVTAATLLVLLIVPLLLAVGGVLAWYAPLITGVDSEYENVVRITTALLVLALITQKVFDIFESILRGMNLGFKRMGVQAAIFLGGGLLQITAVLLGYGLIVLSTIQVLIALTLGITVWWIVKRHVDWFGWGRIELKKSLSFFKTSGWFMGWGITHMLLHNIDKILLGYFTGPILVTQYVITEYMIRAARDGINNVIHGVIPGLGKLFGQKDFDRLSKAREHIMQLTWILAVSVGATVFIFNESFTKLWIGEDQFAGSFANFLIIMISIQYLFIQNDSALISVTLDMRRKVYLGLTSAILSAGLVLLLVPDYEIVGLCIGILVGRLLMSAGYPLIVSGKIGKKTVTARKLIRPALATSAVAAAAAWTASLHIEWNWLTLIAGAVGSVGLFAAAAFYTGLNERQRAEILNYRSEIRLFKSD